MRLRQQVAATGDPVLVALDAELSAYPAPDHDETPDANAVVVPMRIHSALGELAFLSTTTVFGTPVAVTLSELAIESFFPADAHTAEVLRSAAFADAIAASPFLPPGA